MKVRVRPLNKGETFCCSIRAVKNLFRHTDIQADFSYFGRNYSTMIGTQYDTYYLQKIKGRVIASLSMTSRQKSPILSFYVLHECDFPLSLKQEFEERCLPQFLELYEELLNDQNIITTTKYMLTELVNGMIVVHQQTIKH